MRVARLLGQKHPYPSPMLTLAEFDALLQRYLAGQSLPAEQRLVARWSQQLDELASPLLLPEQLAEARTAMWQRIVELTAADQGGGVVVPLVLARRTWWQRPALRWAAAAALTLGAGGWGIRQYYCPVPAAPALAQWAERTNTNQPTQLLQLADGTRVTLYRGSSLRYRAGLPGARREVYLAGQGFFQVAKNPARPFLVYTEQLVTTVLGTSFLVTAYAHQTNKVAVREGRVAVQPRQGAILAATPAHPAATGVLLLPNQQTMYCGQHLYKTLVAEPAVLVPQALAFKNQPVADVLAALGTTYGVNIVFDPARLHGCTVTIAFGDESLYEQLDTLCKILNASYKVVNNAQLLFESRGCTPSAS